MGISNAIKSQNRTGFLARISGWSAIFASAVLLAGSWPALAAGPARVVDPGPRPGALGAGGPLPGLNDLELGLFRGALASFNQVDSVSGTLPNETGGGLGPRFNGNFCGMCHAFPATGGTSPFVNPQIPLATLDGARNTVPPFLQSNGPIREARFPHRPDGSPDGSVHQLFVISGRPDAGACAIKQPDFKTELARNNVIFRIPTPLFGLGLVENVADSTLMATDAAHGTMKKALGIAGHFQFNDNDGTISRFGWKAQNKSLLLFSGEAYNVEQGVTNELFPNELEKDPACQLNPLPEDATMLTNTANSGSVASDASSGLVNFAAFMRLLAAPQPATPTPSSKRGEQVFHDTGCESCHFASLKTEASIFTNQSHVTIHPFSDFEVHAMGTNLADGVTQGSAKGDQFRTAPLWGIGQRIFFLHDGRTNSLLSAITSHASPGSEANQVVARFNMLTPAQKQDLLNFLRSL